MVPEDDPMDDVLMSDAAQHPPPSSAASRPPSDRPAKRRRCSSDVNDNDNPASALRLHHLPAHALISIVRHVHAAMAPRPLFSMSATPSTSSPPALGMPRAADLAPLLRMRCIHPTLRDAVDAHITSLDLCGIHRPEAVTCLVTRFLPRLRNLAAIALPVVAPAAEAAAMWQAFFAASCASLRHVVFVPRGGLVPSKRNDPANEQQRAADPEAAEAAVASVVARASAHSLESIATASPRVLAAVVEASADPATGAPPGGRIATVDVVMDEVNEGLLGRLRALRGARLLYRRGLSRARAAALATQLRSLPALTSVQVRANGVRSCDVDMLAAIPRLTRVALFDGRVDALAAPRRSSERGGGESLKDEMEQEEEAVASELAVLGRCAALSEVQLEWMDGLRDEDVIALARGLGGRLRGLRIWHCEGVTDRALGEVGRRCPAAEVELRFVREQFSQQALAQLGDRVSWASTVE